MLPEPGPSPFELCHVTAWVIVPAAVLLHQAHVALAPFERVRVLVSVDLGEGPVDIGLGSFAKVVVDADDPRVVADLD